MSSSGKGQSTIKSEDDIALAWTYAQEGGRAGEGRVIVEGLVDFDYEITLLTVRHEGGTSFCEPVGHMQVDGDYRESWQPQAMSAAALEESKRGREGWQLSSRGSDGVTRHEHFDFVVIAIGVYSHTPSMPEFPNQDVFSGKIMHNNELKTVEQLEGRKVVVLGYGKSATDAALLAEKHAEEASIVFREPRWPVPSRLFGRIPFKYALFTRFTNIGGQCCLDVHMYIFEFD